MTKVVMDNLIKKGKVVRGWLERSFNGVYFMTFSFLRRTSDV